LSTAGLKVFDASKCQMFALNTNENTIETIHIRNIPQKSSLRVITGENMTLYGSYVQVPNSLTAEFFVNTSNTTYFLNDKNFLFLTFVSKSIQVASYMFSIDVAGNSSLSEF